MCVLSNLVEKDTKEILSLPSHNTSLEPIQETDRKTGNAETCLMALPYLIL